MNDNPQLKIGDYFEFRWKPNQVGSILFNWYEIGYIYDMVNTSTGRRMLYKLIIDEGEYVLNKGIMKGFDVNSSYHTMCKRISKDKVEDLVMINEI